MNPEVDLQNVSGESVPGENDFHRWVAATLAAVPAATRAPSQHAPELTVRLVDGPEMARLNKTFRGREGTTNVLSFPAELPPELQVPLLGDIVICAPVVRQEAADQAKALAAHWAHMAVHGTLHLLGYDHVEEADATSMEALESVILRGLGFDCPYVGAPATEEVTP